MVHVFRLGPMPFEGRDELVYVAGDDEGVLDVVLAHSDDAGLAELVRRHSKAALTVDPALANAARRHHLRTAPLSDDVLVLRAMMSISLLLGLETTDEAFRMLPPLLGAAARFASAAPWARFGSCQELRLEIEGRHYEGAVLGELGESFGLVLYPEPGSMRRIAELGHDPQQLLSIPCLALDLEDEPEFALKAIEEIGFPVLPMVMKVGHAGPVRPTAMDVALLTAAANAVIALSGPDARGEALAEGPGGRVVSAKATLSRWVPFVPEIIQGGPNAVVREPRALRRLDVRLVDEILGFAERHWPGWVADTSTRALGAVVDGDALAQFAFPWLAYSAETPAGESAAALFLADREGTLSGDEASWIGAQLRAWLSIWEVLEVRPGKGLVLLDLLSGERREVHDEETSKKLPPRSAILARVVELDELTVVADAHPEVLDPRAADAVLTRLRKKLKLGTGQVDRRALDVETVSGALAREWARTAAEVLERRDRAHGHTNTDGDPLVCTQDHFEIAAGARAEVLARIAQLPGATLETRDDELVLVTILRDGNALHPEWASTVIGTLRVGTRDLRADTNSVRRADALRADLERVLGAFGRFRIRVHPTVELAAGGDDGPPCAPVDGRRDDGPSRAMYRRWLTTPRPELAGKTPREAIGTAARRRVVHLLLKEIEHRASSDEVGAWLRAELGLGDDGTLLLPPR